MTLRRGVAVRTLITSPLGGYVEESGRPFGGTGAGARLDTSAEG
ncbi:hypothetical protein [Nocardia testacea]